MSVHYRFKSALEYDTITFDGLHISVKDLKNSIIQQKRIGKSTDFDLTITNAQTQEVYKDENALIPKNTSLLIARVPVAVPKQKQWEGYGGNDTPPAKTDEGGAIGKAVDLAKLDAPEDDKIKAMMSQSTQDYDPSNYVKIRGANQVGPVPPSYRCYKCHQTGHWIKDCPLGQGGDAVEIKKSTGIPQSFMVPVEGPQVPGAMMTPNGQYAVPALDYQAYSQKSAPAPAVQEPKPEIPEDLLCSICSDLLTDAVMIPCCGNSFCDECIRTVLLESEDHECPDCHEKEISPGTLIPNRFLRKSVANFKNTTGYEKKPVFKEKSHTEVPKTEPSKKEYTPPPIVDSTEKEKGKSEEEKTVISEADSTEQAKSDDLNKEVDLEQTKTKTGSSSPDRPPGVSPSRPGSPKHHIKSKVNSRERDHRKHRSRRSESPLKSRHKKSPSYHGRSPQERHGTPTRDEPPGLGTSYLPPNSSYNNGGGSSSVVNPENTRGSVSNIPPGSFPPGQQPPLSGFPPQGPPPNFGLPPPGAPPFLGPGNYSLPPRPVFDPSRPPLGGPPGSYSSSFGGGRSHRDYNRGRNRTPPMLIEDPLTAFNRILREKDERRAKQRYVRRSWSRSRSRSYSRSPPPRRRSRSPRRRSRSRSFSISRSRSRSYSKSPRGSPYRQGSPASRRSPLPPPTARKGPPRYRSPVRSPPPRRGRNSDRDRDRDYDSRDYREDRGNYREKNRRERRDSRERLFDERDYDRDRKGRSGPPPMQPQLWNAPSNRDAYYPPPVIQPQPTMLPQQQGFPSRYPPRDYRPPHMAPPIPNIPPPPQRRFDDIAPPGVEEPPIPGLESELPEINEYNRKPGEVKEKYTSPKVDDKERSKRERREDRRSRSRSPERWRNPSPKPRGETPEKPRKRRSSSDRDDRKKDRDHSEDERKKSKEKRKHKEKKDEKKKKRDKKEKHKKADKEKKEKGKDEFKQVIPKNVDESDEDSNGIKKRLGDRKSIDEDKSQRKKEREEEDRIREEKRLAEERKKEERRLRFLEDEKKRKAEEAKKKAAEEARRKALEEEEEMRQKQIDLYEDVLSEKEKETVSEVAESFTKNDEPEEEGEVAESSVKEVEEEDAGILELHSSDMDIKMENDILAPLPEKSKWEVDEEGQMQTSPTESGRDKNEAKTAKVTNEVLKRAENAIFAKAINAIRPIEIKRISSERAKLYSDDKKLEPAEEPKQKVDVAQEKPKLSIKDRLGVKVDEPDRVILIDGQHRGRTVSPFSRRERKMELEESRRHEKNRRSRSRRRETSHDKQKENRNKDSKKIERNRRDSKRDDSKVKSKVEEKKEKRKRSRSKSENEEHRKKRKEKKRDERKKSKKRDDEKEESNKKQSEEKDPKRKTTLDESSFEPDYDLELHTDGGSSDEGKDKKNAKKKDDSDEEESSSSESSSSSSEEERRKKRHKRHRKKRRRESSSSSSESSSESSDSEREKKRNKKHKKTKKKKKKSKHK